MSVLMNEKISRAVRDFILLPLTFQKDSEGSGK